MLKDTFACHLPTYIGTEKRWVSKKEEYSVGLVLKWENASFSFDREVIFVRVSFLARIMYCFIDKYAANCS